MTLRAPTLLESYELIRPDDWRWPNFTPFEMSCRKTRALLVNPQFMDRLQAIRERLGFPFRVTSAYRDPAYNAQISSTGTSGPHTTGRAVDVAAWGPHADALIDTMREFGFLGRGMRQHGPFAQRFVHLDDLEDAPGCPRPRSWTYDRAK